jgi:hypothetical protein
MMAPLPLPLAQAAATGSIWSIRRAISGRSDSRAQDVQALKASGERPRRDFEQRDEASARRSLSDLFRAARDGEH